MFPGDRAQTGSHRVQQGRLGEWGWREEEREKERRGEIMNKLNPLLFKA